MAYGACRGATPRTGPNCAGSVDKNREWHNKAVCRKVHPSAIALFNHPYHRGTRPRGDGHFSYNSRNLIVKRARTEPLTLIDDLKPSNDNYETALDILKARYDNKCSIINSHIKSLFELPQIIKSNSTSLRDFNTNIKKHLNALKGLEVPVQQWDLLLIHIFSNKLDFQTHKALN
ncbi:hypothetical protein NQ317_015323 [Molorchus minor]|uniref:Retrovirus-related Pol polyprotein from transposon TNT 1-94 n=1 Tax=Molorchus minor TaxID=1323400 RepID=A0ABQ9JBS6_9CUCU|nr:hypothetical protein NQ317_015323 [Molorchus minor]